MEDIKISVDEILEEIQFNKAKEKLLSPSSDMKSVNDLVEQLLMEKKTAQLKQEKSNVDEDELESFRQEIKAQTKSITKQYEKFVRECTRQEKKLHKEIHPDYEDEEAFAMQVAEQKMNTQTLKIAKIAAEQKVKLQSGKHEDAELEAKKEKLEMLKQSAHSEHIKKELDSITSHFGNVKMPDATAAQGRSKSEITPTTYKELKKNRNKKIDSFLLEPAAPPNAENDEDASNDIDADIISNDELLQNNEATKGNKSEYDDDDDNIYENEYVDVMQAEDVKEDLNRQKNSNIFHIIVFILLSIGAIALCLVVPAMDSATNTVQLQFAKIMPVTTLFYVMANMVLLILTMAFSGKVFSNAIYGLINHLPSKEILYSVTLIFTFITNIIMMFDDKKVLTSGVHLYTPIIVVSLLFYYISQRYTIIRTVENFDFITSDADKYAVMPITDAQIANDMTKGALEDAPLLTKNVKTDFFKNFLTHSFQPDKSDAVCSKLTVFMLPIALAIAAATYYFTKDLYVALTALTGTLVVSTTLFGGLIVTFPLNDTSDVTMHFSEMSPCVDAIESFKNTNAMLIDAYDLFPSETVILHGIKTFSGKRIDDAIIDAASVVCQSKSILSQVFMDIIANNKSLLKKVDTILYEDLMGISAWVDDKRVLIGNRELMINHSIAVPKKEYEDKYRALKQDVVYISTDGELSAAFIIQLTTRKEIFDVMNLLERNEIHAILKTVDCVLTVEKMAELYHIDASYFKILPSRLHKAFADEVSPEEKTETVLGTNGTLLGYIISTVATKKLSYCIGIGVSMNILSIVLAVILFVGMMLIGKLALLSNIVLLAYMALFGAIYWIYQKNIHL